jgi:ABC-2 type transport system permease protein
MRATLATVRAAFTDTAAKRAAFWSQVMTMVINDVAWVAFWVLFFHRVGTIRGWDAHRVLLLFAVLTTSAGLVLGLFSNARRIPSLVADGALDEILSLPVAPLPNLLVRRFDAINIGDMAFGLTLFAVLGDPTPARVAMFLACSAAGALVFTGFLVATGSLVFFTGGGEGGDLGMHALLLLASYPAEVFTGATKALLYTVVPAAFVAAVPSRLVDDFGIGQALALAGAATFFATLGWTTFHLGLRRYTSGSAWARG